MSKTYLYENATFPQLITGIIDEKGNRYASIAYDAQGRGVSTQLAGGADLHTVSYGTTGSATVTDPLGTQRTYSYGTTKGKLAVLGADKPSGTGHSSAVSRVQDANGFVTQETDFLGMVTTYTWDPNRRLLLSTTKAAGQPEAQTSATQWHPTFRLPVLVTEPGRTTAYSYDSVGNQLSQTVTESATNQSRTTSWTYNTQGLPITVTAPNADVTQYRYDSQGNLTGTTSAAGHITSYNQYDQAGRVRKMTDPKGVVTDTSYTPRGWISSTTVTPPGGAARTTTYNYDNAGQLTGVVMPDASTLAYSYDAAHRLTGVTDAKGNSVTYTLDNMGNRIGEQVKDPQGNLQRSITRVYDALNRVQQTTAGPMTWQYGYDAMGRPTTVLDPNGQTTYTYYDSLGRPIQTQEPPNTGSVTPTITSFAYNAADSLTKVTDPRSLETSYSPNGLGDVTAQSSPDTGASQYTYDANGNVLTKTDARGKLTQYAYDNLNRLTTVTYPTGAPTLIEYDGGSTPTPAAVGELTKITDTSGQTSYGYDSLGRKTSKTTVINGKSFTVTYTWGDSGSALDKLTAITYPSGSRVNYSYDAQGQASSISVNPANANGVGTNTGTGLPLLSGITTNAETKLTGWSWASSKAQAVSYDSVGQISAYNLGDSTGTGTAAGVRRTLTHDSAGRIVAYTHANNGIPVPSLDQSFTYDNLNRMVSASLGNSAIQYSYDATGNRTSKTISGTTYPNTIQSTSNKLSQMQDVLGTAAIVHDAAGNITSDGLNTYTYSDRGRLATMTNAGGTVTYSYNALEQRVGKTGPTALVPTGATYYVYDEAGKLLGEYDANGVPQYETIYLGSPVGVMVQTGSVANSDIAVSLYNVWADQVGAPRVITRSSDEAIVWRWDSAEAFGATAPDQNPNNLGTFTFNQRLPGQVFDAESGLFQNWNREYNPRIGRYMQSDPIGLQGGINTYSYVGGDPLGSIDFDGLQQTRAPVPTVTYSQGVLNLQGSTLIRQIREYQPNFTYARISAPGVGFNAGNIRELQGTFQRLQQLEICPANSVISETMAARGNITSQHPLTADQLLRAGEIFLGSRYSELGRPGSGVFRSADGTRQFRIDSNSIQGNHSPGVPHGHLETYAPGSVRPIANNHIPFSE